jgi:hypothetical protein
MITGVNTFPVSVWKPGGRQRFNDELPEHPPATHTCGSCGRVGTDPTIAAMVAAAGGWERPASAARSPGLPAQHQALQVGHAGRVMHNGWREARF